MSNEQNSKKQSIGGIWIRESKSGDRYVSLQVEVNGQKVNLVGFKNKYKEEGGKQPDYKLYPSEPKPQAPKFDDAF